MDHWQYVLFGVSTKKLLGYNKYFGDTYHIIPSSTTRLIPDTYHIILTILLIVTLIYMIRKIYKLNAYKNASRFSETV
jgi:hypothetical protein